MGLDMYLSAKRYLWNISDDDRALAEKIGAEVGGESLGQTKEVAREAFYWRKAWAIHHWFVMNAQRGCLVLIFQLFHLELRTLASYDLCRLELS